MGAGLAQVGVLLLLTVVGLPLFFFGLMAALDHFERTLSASPRTVLPVTAVLPVTPAASAAAPPQSAIKADADVLTLPVAATNAGSTSSAANPAAAV